MALTYGFSLRQNDNSADFANALYNIVGDGVAQHGGQFALTVNGFSVTVASGYAFAAGRWLENTEPHQLTVNPSKNTADRTDALVCRVDYAERKATLEIIVDVGSDAIRADPSVLRNDNAYIVFLYFIRVKRGATSLTPSDITDLRGDSNLCGRVLPLSTVSGDALRVYQFLSSGINEEIDRVIALSDAMIAKADNRIAELNRQIEEKDGAPQIGELLLTCVTPTPKNEWLLCDGGAVPAEYARLSALLGGVLPNLSAASDRYRTYIYGGPSGEPDPGYREPDSGIVGIAVVGTAKVGEEVS